MHLYWVGPVQLCQMQNIRETRVGSNVFPKNRCEPCGQDICIQVRSEKSWSPGGGGRVRIDRGRGCELMSSHIYTWPSISHTNTWAKAPWSSVCTHFQTIRSSPQPYVSADIYCSLSSSIKGIVLQFCFYCSKPLFWIVVLDFSDRIFWGTIPLWKIQTSS